MENHYKQILEIIQNMSIAMERSPTAFAKLEEEHLRFHFLIQLNGVYEGEAMGEAFNYQGKTDILVRSGGHNLFIAECKFWGGEQVLLDTTDQLFRYVTWREGETRFRYMFKHPSHVWASGRFQPHPAPSRQS
jgi:hypothetical protein